MTSVAALALAVLSTVSPEGGRPDAAGAAVLGHPGVRRVATTPEPSLPGRARSRPRQGSPGVRPDGRLDSGRGA